MPKEVNTRMHFMPPSSKDTKVPLSVFWKMERISRASTLDVLQMLEGGMIRKCFGFCKNMRPRFPNVEVNIITVP